MGKIRKEKRKRERHTSNSISVSTARRVVVALPPSLSPSVASLFVRSERRTLFTKEVKQKVRQSVPSLSSLAKEEFESDALSPSSSSSSFLSYVRPSSSRSALFSLLSLCLPAKSSTRTTLLLLVLLFSWRASELRRRTDGRTFVQTWCFSTVKRRKEPFATSGVSLWLTVSNHRCVTDKQCSGKEEGENKQL